VAYLPDLPSSAVRRALAAELRRLREHAGISGDDVAGRLGWSGSKVSRIETHRTGVKPSDLELLLDLYDVDDEQRGRLRALADEQDARGWWSVYASTFPAKYIAYIELEAAAAKISCWSPELIHGLLQTEHYAGAATRTVFGDHALVSPGEIQRRIDARLRRQLTLTQPDPKQFNFVLDEAALRHRFGTAAIMRAQMQQLARLSQLPNVTIQVLPFAGSYPIGPGGFALLDFGPIHGMKLNDVVYIEHLTGNAFVEEEAETYEYRVAFERLTNEALDEDASRKLINKVAREIWT
jgi:transcriptional regulator with XRE-family HTH domain